MTTAIVMAPGIAYAARPTVRAPAAAASRVQHTWKLGIAAYGSNHPLGWATAPSDVAPSWSSSAPVRRGGATGYDTNATNPTRPLAAIDQANRRNPMRSRTAVRTNAPMIDGQYPSP